MKLRAEYLAAILVLLETKSFEEIGVIYNAEVYNIVRFLRRMGINPNVYKRGEKNVWKTKKIEPVEISKRPQLLRVYKEKGVEIKVYQSRYASGI